MTLNKVGRRALSLLMAAVLGASITVAPAAANVSATAATQTITTSADLLGVSFVDRDHGWVVGSGGYIAATADGGSTWTRQSSGITSRLTDVDFVDELHGWAVGDLGVLLRTDDGGNTWSASTAGVLGALAAVDFVDENHGWAVGSDPALVSTVFATNDGGKTWTRQVAQGALGLVDVAFDDAQNGMAVGFSGAAFRTDNGGVTWLPMTPVDAAGASFYGVAVDGPQALMGAFTGALLRSTDSGGSWSKTESGTSFALHSVALEGDVALSAGERAFLGFSSDGGATWTALPNRSTWTIRRVTIRSDRGYAVGDNGIFITVTPQRDGLPELKALDVVTGTDTCTGLLQPRLIDDELTVALDASGADVDGDGRQEIAVGTLDGVALLTHERTGDAAELWHFPFHTRALAIAVAELDGDPGDELLVGTGRYKTARSGVFALDGDSGTLLWAKQISGGVSRIEAGDLTGDGVSDVVAGGDARGLIFLDGVDGSLLTESKALGAEITDLDVGDVNGDGIIDVAATTALGRVEVYDGQARTRLWSYQNRNGDGVFRAVEIHDVDRDGMAEVAVGGHDTPTSLIPGSGDNSTTVGSRKGAFVALLDPNGAVLWDFADPGSGNTFRGIALADLTGDGIDDLVGHASGIDSGFTYAFDGAGAGLPQGVGSEADLLWSATTRLPGTDAQQVASSESIVFNDVNGDGTPDPIVGVAGGLVAAFDGAPDTADNVSGYRPGVQLWTTLRAAGLGSIALIEAGAGDQLLTRGNDGRLAVANTNDGSASWVYGAGRDARVMPLAADEDAAAEILVGAESGKIYTLEGDGTLVTEEELYVPDPVRALAAWDVDADGDEDALVGTAGGEVWAVDPVTAEVLWTHQSPRRVTTVAAGNGYALVGTANGDYEALDASTGEPAWEGTSGTFVTNAVWDAKHERFLLGSSVALTALEASSGEIIDSIPVGSTRIQLVDIDADGARDVVFSSGSEVRAYDAAFDLMWTFALPLPVGSLSPVDLDGDGGYEIAAATSAEITALEGTAGRDLWTVAAGPFSYLSALDVEGDGDEEVFATATANGLFGLIEVGGGNTAQVVDGDGSALATCDLVRGPLSLSRGDLDGDGAIETFFGSEVGGVMTFLPTDRVPGTTPSPSPSPSNSSSPALPAPVAVDVELLGEAPHRVAYTDTATIAARLTDGATGDSLSGKEVSFLIEGRNGYRSVSATTGNDGVAAVDLPIDLRPGAFVLRAIFAGDVSAAAASDETPFEVIREDVSVQVNLARSGSTHTATAILTDLDDPSRGIAERVVRFYVGGTLVATKRTNAAGEASAPIDVKGSGKQVTAVFDGDDFYRSGTGAATT